MPPEEIASKWLKNTLIHIFMNIPQSWCGSHIMGGAVAQWWGICLACRRLQVKSPVYPV